MAVSMIPPSSATSFLDRIGWNSAAISPLAGDASFRRYFRVSGAQGKAVLMDAPPPHEDARPFLAIARHLQTQGFAAPAIFGEDPELGLVLLEDFGDARVREVVEADPAREHGVYAKAVELLARLHQSPAANVPSYDHAMLQREAALLTEWYCPAAGLTVDETSYSAVWANTFALLDGAPIVTVLRDYHSENIMLLDGNEQLGLLDFQDALAGHPAYDLVSLLQDARRDVSSTLEREMIGLYAQLSGSHDDAAYALLGAQRNAKIVGIFTRLWQRDGKARYLDYLPRVWSYLERDLAHPALSGVKAWFDANIPPAVRRSTLQ